MLRLENLAAGTSKITLLERVELDLANGELVALNGPSGCGKTTLLRTVSGLVDPMHGQVFFEGKTPDEIGWTRFRREVTLVDQRPVLFDDTVSHNLEKPFSYRTSGISEFSKAHAEDLLDKFRVGAHRLTQAARSLSLGQQQRVSLVRALLVSPKVLLLDEPTSALDTDAVTLVEEAIVDEARKRGMAALIVTHDKAQAERLCDRVYDLAPHIVRAEHREDNV